MVVTVYETIIVPGGLERCDIHQKPISLYSKLVYVDCGGLAIYTVSVPQLAYVKGSCLIEQVTASAANGPIVPRSFTDCDHCVHLIPKSQNIRISAIATNSKHYCLAYNSLCSCVVSPLLSSLQRPL